MTSSHAVAATELLPASTGPLRRGRSADPAARPAASRASHRRIALFEPHLLPAGARIDLLTLLEQQKHWLDSVQQRVLAEIEAADASELNLSQEAVSLALSVPVRTAQLKLKTASLLVRELPDTLALLHAGQISYRHAEVICEQAWSLPHRAGRRVRGAGPGPAQRTRPSASCGRRLAEQWPGSTRPAPSERHQHAAHRPQGRVPAG